MMQRKIGNTTTEVNALGLGCMGLSEFYGPPTDEADAIGMLHKALDLGVTHFDTAEVYGNCANETLLGKAFKDRRTELVIATKFGIVRDPDTGKVTGLDGSRENCRRAIEGSLSRLQTDHVDIYYLHRVDPATPIEESVAAMAELVEEGMIRTIGLSEASATTIRRAHAIHPISAIQSEYSLFSRDIEEEVIPACKDIGASLVAYSPLGRGMLSGAFNKDTTFDQEDYRHVAQPRFSGDVLAANLALVEKIRSIAGEHDALPSQVALNWVLQQGEHILTIPGTTKLQHLRSNLNALNLSLSTDDFDTLNGLADQVRGNRYDSRGMTLINA